MACTIRALMDYTCRKPGPPISVFIPKPELEPLVTVGLVRLELMESKPGPESAPL